jgi:adenylyltransferase/sulfurtransferase
MSFRTLKVKRNPECPVCGEHPTVTELIDYEQFCGLPSRNGSHLESVSNRELVVA